MKLYMKQKVFSFVDKFTIKDEEGNDRYKVEGKMLALLKKLHIYNMEGKEVAFLEQKFSMFLASFNVYVKGEHIAQIKQQLSFFKPKYEIKGRDWEVSGNFLGRDYTITDKNGSEVASISKEWMTWGDSYKIDISHNQDEASVLAVVLAIDAVISARR